MLTAIRKIYFKDTKSTVFSMDKKIYDDECAFYCNWCCKIMMLSNMIEKTVKSHMNRESHKASKQSTPEASSLFLLCEQQPAKFVAIMLLLSNFN